METTKLHKLKRRNMAVISTDYSYLSVAVKHRNLTCLTQHRTLHVSAQQLPRIRYFCSCIVHLPRKEYGGKEEIDFEFHSLS